MRAPDAVQHHPRRGRQMLRDRNTYAIARPLRHCTGTRKATCTRYLYMLYFLYDRCPAAESTLNIANRNSRREQQQQLHTDSAARGAPKYMWAPMISTSTLQMMARRALLPTCATASRTFSHRPVGRLASAPTPAPPPPPAPPHTRTHAHTHTHTPTHTHTNTHPHTHTRTHTHTPTHTHTDEAHRDSGPSAGTIPDPAILWSIYLDATRAHVPPAACAHAGEGPHAARTRRGGRTSRAPRRLAGPRARRTARA